MMLRRAASNREELLAETDKLKTELAAQTKLREKEIEDQLKRAEMLEKDVSGLKKDMLEVKKEVVEIKSTQEEHTRQLRRHSEDHGELLAMYQELARDVKDNHQSMEGMKEDMAKNKKDTAEALLLAQKALLLQAVTDLQLAEVDLNFNRFAGKVDALEQLVVKLQNDIPDLKGVIERKTSSMMRLGADETKARIAAMYAVQERLGQVEKGLTVVEVEVKEAVTEAGEAHKRADEAYTLADKARALAAAVATSAGNAMDKLDDLQSKDVPKILTVIASFGEKLGRLEEAVKESPELVIEIEKKARVAAAHGRGGVRRARRGAGRGAEGPGRGAGSGGRADRGSADRLGGSSQGSRDQAHGGHEAAQERAAGDGAGGPEGGEAGEHPRHEAGRDHLRPAQPDQGPQPPRGRQQQQRAQLSGRTSRS